MYTDTITAEFGRSVFVELGLKRGTVALAPHRREWEDEAERTANELRGILGDLVAGVQHVGSTSIATIMAKPIVDVALAVNDFDAVIAKRDELQAAGYYYRKHKDDLPDQLLFARGSYYEGTGDIQTHFIHVVRSGGTEWRDYLNFRDYLRAKPEEAKKYEALKLRLANECPIDSGRERYLSGKHDFIVETLRHALVWSYLGRLIRIGIDRPVGYVHKKENYTLIYPINYGYIPGVLGGDGEELDVYLLGVTEPLSEAECRVIAYAERKNDVEDKLIAAPDGMTFTKDEIARAVNFQEKWYDTEIVTE
jgi:GrpB-like predicted nucleotidyltransferase (UPF0157 family)